MAEWSSTRDVVDGVIATYATEKCSIAHDQLVGLLSCQQVCRGVSGCEEAMNGARKYDLWRG